MPSGLIVFAGVLGIASATAHSEQDVTKIRKRFDLREVLLRRFFQENHCPAERYAGVFVSEADAHGLDWRLLPSLSMVESGGGRYAKGNNLFGWANGRKSFESIGEAIHQVASALAIGKAYRDKDINGKLLTYNHSVDYRTMVTDIMSRIAPVAGIEPAE